MWKNINLWKSKFGTIDFFSQQVKFRIHSCYRTYKTSTAPIIQGLQENAHLYKLDVE